MAVYLDYNATTPIDERVLDLMIDVYRNHYGNADSRTHNHGDQARMIVENARAQVASLLGIGSTEVFFTSGATESNNIAIQGLEAYACSSGKKHIITTSIEHKAVLETAKAMKERGFELDLIDPDESGRINADELLDKVRNDTMLVSVQHHRYASSDLSIPFDSPRHGDEKLEFYEEGNMIIYELKVDNPNLFYNYSIEWSFIHSKEALD